MAGRYPTLDDFNTVTEALRAAGRGGALTFDELRASAPAIGVGKIRVMLSVLKRAGLSPSGGALRTR